MSQYNKAIVAILTGLVTFLVGFEAIPEGTVSEEWIAGVATVLTGGMVWLVPNRPKE